MLKIPLLKATRLIPFLICSLSVLYCQGQVMATIDSLKNDLKRTEVTDSTYITNNLLIGGYFASVNIDSSGGYMRKAIKRSLATDRYKIVKGLGNLGLIHFYQSNADSARYYYDRALEYLDQKDNAVERSTIYANYALSYQNSDAHEKRLEYSQKAIDLVEDDPKEVCLLYFNHSLILQELDDIKGARAYLEKAWETSNISKDYRVNAAALKRLAQYSIEDNDLDQARAYLEEGLELCDILQSPETNYHIYSELGKLYDTMGLYGKAGPFLKKAHQNAVARNHKFEIMASYIYLGKHEFLQGNYSKANDYFERFEALYQIHPEPKLGVQAYATWGGSEHKRGRYKKSNEIYSKYIKLKDSVFSENSRKAVADAETKYQTEKKDKEIATQQLALSEQEAQIQKKQAQNNYMLGAVLFLATAGLLLLFLFKQRQKRKNQELLTLKRDFQIKTLESLIEGEEKERLRVAKELHDGVNGDLAAIKYKLSSLLEMNHTVIQEAITMIDDSCKQVRAISHNLIPPSLENFDLVEATQIFCSNLNDVLPETEIVFLHIGETVGMPKKAEVNAFRIIQELVNNAVRHAEATQIDVQLSSRENTVQITVEDDGKGFDSEKLGNEGIGLGNVRSRIDYLKATTDFISNEKGTSYTIEFNKDEIYGD
ncbi:hypothetical protein B7P33_18040 [Sediminicola luteus]|uniref:histidine kinase n=1 Tax=Sediminicola luteus TaxID=319238 RepID=A0A2A4G3H7_9FLAO|nr:hypothetical protein B7P33_18040 [Sediminicola luteus]